MYFCKELIVTYQPFESTPFPNITYVLGSKSHRLQCNRQHKNGQNGKYQPSNQYYIHFTLSPKSINFSPSRQNTNPCELCYVNVFLPLMKQEMRNHFNRRANGVEAEIYFSEVSGCVSGRNVGMYILFLQKPA